MSMIPIRAPEVTVAIRKVRDQIAAEDAARCRSAKPGKHTWPVSSTFLAMKAQKASTPREPRPARAPAKQKGKRMRFRDRVRLMANELFRDQGAIDPNADATVIADRIRADPVLLEAFIADDLVPAIRRTLRTTFPATKDQPRVGSAVATREAIREQVAVKVQAHPTFSAMLPRQVSLPDLMAMTRFEVRGLAEEYAHAGIDHLTIARWLRAISLQLEDRETVGDRFSSQALETMFEEARIDQLAPMTNRTAG